MPGAARFRSCALLLLALTVSHASQAVRLRPLAAIDTDQSGSGLRQPEGVAFDGKSLLAVADTGNKRVVKYTIVADRATPAGEIRLGELPYPIRVQISSKGELLALDGRTRRIVRISPAGEFKGFIEPEGEGAAGALIARSFAIDREDNLFILDVSRARILVLAPDGRTRRSIAYPGERGFLSDLVVDGRGTVFAVDSVGRRVFVAKPADPVLAPLTSEMKDDISFPTAIAVDGQGRIYVADENDGGIVILGADGSFRGRQAGSGWKEGSLRYPTGICAGLAGTIFVADRENNRVQMFAVSD